MKTLLERIVFGVLFLVVVIGCLMVPWGLLALVCFLSVALSHEFYRMMLGARFPRERICVTLASLAVLACLFFHFQAGWPFRYVALGFLPVMASHVFLLFDGAKNHEYPTEIYFPLVYVTFPLAAMLTLAWPGGTFTWRILLGVMTLMWVNDVGAYVVGMSFGQRPDSRKLFPALSPKKSWVGVFGGTAFTFLAAWGISLWFGAPVLSLPHWLAIAAIVSVFGVFGDLFESLLKRHAQVKDAGHFLPGHGGLLDRFDDVLFVMPLTALYLMLFSLI